MSRRTAQAQTSEVICLDSDEEAGPSSRPATPSAPKLGRRSGSARRVSHARRRPAQTVSPALGRGTAGGSRQSAPEARLSVEVVDLTGADEVEVACDEAARKRARYMPLPFSAPEPPPREAKPDAKCAICLEPMVEMACGPCGHVYCDSCLRASVKGTKRCPTCRKSLQLRQIHRIYLSLD